MAKGKFNLVTFILTDKKLNYETLAKNNFHIFQFVIDVKDLLSRFLENDNYQKAIQQSQTN